MNEVVEDLEMLAPTKPSTTLSIVATFMLLFVDDDVFELAVICAYNDRASAFSVLFVLLLVKISSTIS